MTDRDRALETIVDFSRAMDGAAFGTVLADPPWRFVNRTGKVAPRAPAAQPLRDDDDP